MRGTGATERFRAPLRVAWRMRLTRPSPARCAGRKPSGSCATCSGRLSASSNSTSGRRQGPLLQRLRIPPPPPSPFLRYPLLRTRARRLLSASFHCGIQRPFLLPACTLLNHNFVCAHFLRPLRFWVTMLCFVLLFVARPYVHAMGQWLLLNISWVPVDAYEPYFLFARSPDGDLPSPLPPQLPLFVPARHPCGSPLRCSPRSFLIRAFGVAPANNQWLASRPSSPCDLPTAAPRRVRYAWKLSSIMMELGMTVVGTVWLLMILLFLIATAAAWQYFLSPHARPLSPLLRSLALALRRGEAPRKARAGERAQGRVAVRQGG